MLDSLEANRTQFNFFYYNNNNNKIQSFKDFGLFVLIHKIYMEQNMDFSISYSVVPVRNLSNLMACDGSKFVTSGGSHIAVASHVAYDNTFSTLP